MRDCKIISFFNEHKILPMPANNARWRNDMISGALEICAYGLVETDDVQLSPSLNFIKIGHMPSFQIDKILRLDIFTETTAQDVLDLIVKKIAERDYISHFCLKINDEFVVTDKEIYCYLDAITTSILILTKGKTNPVLVKNMVKNYLAQQIFFFTLRGILETLDKEKTIDLWSEGYEATGQSSTATFHGTYKATCLLDAVKAYANTLTAHERSYIDYETLRIWGCRFFDNEAAARKSFG